MFYTIHLLIFFLEEEVSDGRYVLMEPLKNDLEFYYSLLIISLFKRIQSNDTCRSYGGVHVSRSWSTGSIVFLIIGFATGFDSATVLATRVQGA